MDRFISHFDEESRHSWLRQDDRALTRLLCFKIGHYGWYFKCFVRLSRRVRRQSQLGLCRDVVSNATLASNAGGYRDPRRDGVFVADERQPLPLVPVLGVSWTW